MMEGKKREKGRRTYIYTNRLLGRQKTIVGYFNVSRMARWKGATLSIFLS